MAQRLARGAHNSEVTRSKRVAGIHKGNLRLPSDPSLQIRARGQRGQHVPCITSHRCIKALEQLSSLVAQRKRAVKHRLSTPRCENIRKIDGYRLMSRRSHDRNVSGEFLLFIILTSAHFIFTTCFF